MRKIRLDQNWSVEAEGILMTQMIRRKVHAKPIQSGRFLKKTRKVSVESNLSPTRHCQRLFTAISLELPPHKIIPYGEVVSHIDVTR